MKLYHNTRWFGLFNLAIVLFLLAVLLTVLVQIPLWKMERRLARPDPHSSMIIRIDPDGQVTFSNRPYPKRPCPDCLLKHKLGACLTNQIAK